MASKDQRAITPRFVQIYETLTGGMYAIVNFVRPDGRVVLTEDFVFDASVFANRRVVRTDPFGRVIIKGKQEWPLDLDTGELRPDYSSAVREVRATSDQEHRDAILGVVLRLRDQHFTGTRTGRAGNKTLPEIDHPAAKPRSVSGLERGVAALLRDTPITDTADGVATRQRDRRRAGMDTKRAGRTTKKTVRLTR